MKRARTLLARMIERLLVWFWKHRAPVTTPATKWKTAPADNLQQHMNLVVPLADTTAVGRAEATQAIAASIDELFTGLNNIGTVHFARFDLIGPNLCMLSVYDGDFEAYIRDFISIFGSVFDDLFKFAADPPPTPCTQHPQAFVDWVRRHDAFQIPGDVSALFPGEQDIRNIPRDLVLLLDQNPVVQLGRYSGYPGLSVAQLRLGAGIGW
jgi:hypothetical protein